LCEKLTDMPKLGCLPHTSQTAAMTSTSHKECFEGQQARR
jgi:hypothetical protein